MISSLNTAKNALFFLSRNPLLLLASTATDVTALFTFGYLSTPIYNKLTEHAIILGTLISQPAAKGTAFLTTLTAPTALPYTTNILFLLTLLLILTTTLFTISQTITYTLASKTLNKHFKTAPFLKTTIIWTPILAIMYALHLFADLRHTILNKITPIPNTLGTILWIIDGILILIALTTFPAGIKTGLRWIRTKPTTFLTTSMITTILLIINNTLLTYLSLQSTELLVIAGLFLFFPTLLWLRILYTAEVTNVRS